MREVETTQIAEPKVTATQVDEEQSAIRNRLFSNSSADYSGGCREVQNETLQALLRFSIAILGVVLMDGRDWSVAYAFVGEVARSLRLRDEAD
ncbi:hypothetical protein ALC60_07628 [Trachymyrmex zeteki]|uniref:Uncharacterized protein n=1 Tax=Mycetomoellerius zeteki TaxID=64791 RepID=A0A151WZB2_9HYME|nr:hypothetical protein ALC60_07628 [Trachymyrmex zeteki]